MFDSDDPLWRKGYEAGYAQALQDAAERVDELDAIWKTVPRPSYEQKVAARAAEMAARAVTDYPGGPLPTWEETT